MSKPEQLAIEELSKVRTKITTLLMDYPNISQSMIGIHVRPQTGPLWKAVLEAMIDDGTVVRETVFKEGRTFHTHHLAGGSDARD